MGKFEGKRVIITGGDQGIGEATALAFATEGAKIVITYNTNKTAAETLVNKINQCSEQATAIQTDVSKTDNLNLLVKKSIIFLGGIDILVNNAGIYSQKGFLDISEQDYDKTMAVNLKGPFFLTQLVCKQMILQNKEHHNNGGCVINISSIRDKAPAPTATDYQASKAGLTMFSKAASAAMTRNHHIRFVTISPGRIKTNIQRHLWENNPSKWQERVNEIPLERAGNPEDVAKVILSVASDDSYITGARILVDGGLNLHVPANQMPTYSTSDTPKARL